MNSNPRIIFEYSDVLMYDYDNISKEEFDIRYNKALEKAKEKYGTNFISCTIEYEYNYERYSDEREAYLYLKIKRYETEEEINLRINKHAEIIKAQELREKELYEQLKKKFK